jgi:hypothetical protein
MCERKQSTLSPSLPPSTNQKKKKKKKNPNPFLPSHSTTKKQI